MNFDLDPEERALRDAVRDLCARRFADPRAGFSLEGWRELGEAGVFSLRHPDGAGLGMTEAVIVFQELGRALVSGPLVATHLAAGLVEGASTGEAAVSWVHGGLVSFAGHARAVLLSSGGRLVEVDVEGENATSLDPLTPLLRVGSLRERAVLAEQAAGFERDGAALTAALASGIASRTAEMAVSYAKERVQFGRPIGSFQAVKHLCADMFARAEVARAATDAAGVLLDEGSKDAERAVSVAKLLACEAALANGKGCLQVHGGMGFTWEVDVHLYLKRAAVLAVEFGSLDEHAERIASLYG